MRRRRTVLGPLGAVAIGGLLLAACGEGADGDDPVTDDTTEEATDDATEDAGEESADDADGEEAQGDGDVDASTVTFDGEDLPLDQVECQEQFDRDGVQISAYAPFDDDPVERKVLRVKQHDDGAAVRIYRAADLSVEFDGHEWGLSATDRPQVQDIDWDGASAGPLDLGISQGNDEEQEAEDATLEFDLVC